MVKYLIFDLDDTLYNERDFVYAGFTNVAIFLGKKHQRSSDEILAVILNIFHEKGRGKIFDELCTVFDFQEDIDTLVNIYRNVQPALKLYKDAEDLLNRVKGRYGLGIITDGMGFVQWNKIEALGLKRYIDKIIVTDDFGKDFWKPSIQPFLKMMDHFGGRPEEYVYVGDNPLKDFIAPKKLGMHSVRIIRDVGDYMQIAVPSEFEADYTIYSLADLEKYLRDLADKNQRQDG